MGDVIEQARRQLGCGGWGQGLRRVLSASVLAIMILGTPIGAQESEQQDPAALQAEAPEADDQEFGVEDTDDQDAEVDALEDDEFVPEEEVTFEDATDFSAIDDMLALDDEVLSNPDTYSYDPGLRRDPFRSLARRRSRAPSAEKRPDGPAGLSIDEIEVEGVFVLSEGPVVQVQSASQETSFLLRVGDQLWDGDVIRITLDEVVFKQASDDPTDLKPFREVVKKLN